MGFLSRLFKVFKQKNKEQVNEFEYDIDIHIHDSLDGLIWFYDGPYKNYEYIPCTLEINVGSAKFGFDLNQPEPSAISLTKTIRMPKDINNVDNPSYYPSYDKLTPEQRYLYFKFLENPFNGNFSISYAFMLLYGLERFMLVEDSRFDDIFNIIIKLRDTFNNKSFQQYTANTLIIMALKNRRMDLLSKFISSLDKDYEMQFSPNLFLLAALILNIPIESAFILHVKNFLGFTTNTYIKKDYDTFSKILQKMIEEKYPNGLFLKDLFIGVDSKAVPMFEEKLFCNYSINNTVKLPNFSQCYFVKVPLLNLLLETHDYIKHNKNLIKQDINDEKPAKIEKNLYFNKDEEKEFLARLKSSKDLLDRHFKLMEIQKFYYKFRSLDDKYLQASIMYCEEDLSIIMNVKETFIRDFNSYHSIVEKDNNREFKIGVVDTFERLETIYKKQKDFGNAIRVCNLAIEYYEGYFPDFIDKFNKKREWHEKQLGLVNKQ